MWRTFQQLFWPQFDGVSLHEKLYSGLAALGGIGLIMFTSSLFLQPADLPWVVASMGASAVLLFAVPLGPLSQPWNLVGGHLISGVIGVTIGLLVPDMVLSSALAVSLAIVVMYITRCLHPPGGATALTVVAGGAGIRAMGFDYLLTPVLVNVVVILAWALLINNLIPNRYYPNTLKGVKERRGRRIGDDTLEGSLSIDRDDLSYALLEMDEFIDVSQDDLTRIFNISATHARRRRMGEILCREIMTREVITAEYGDEVETLWRLMGQHRIRGIPIIQPNRRVIGMVTIADFLNQVKAPSEEPLKVRLLRFLRRSSGVSSDKPEYAGHIMSSPAILIHDDQHILDLFPIFYEQGVHHLPVVDDQERLCGIITPKNLLAALHADLTHID